MFQKGSTKQLISSLFIFLKCLTFCFYQSEFFDKSNNYVIYPFKGDNLSHEVNECIIPNCHSTTWKVTRRNKFQVSPRGTILAFVFDSTLEVRLLQIPNTKIN